MGDARSNSGSTTRYGPRQFSDDAIASFPELSDDLGSHRDLHAQIRSLALAVRRSIESGDTALPLKISMFLDDALGKQSAACEVENAVAISFIQPFVLRKTATGALFLRMMPERLRRILLHQEEQEGSW